MGQEQKWEEAIKGLFPGKNIERRYMKILRKLPPAEIIEDVLLIAMSLSYLHEFASIWLYGIACFEEPNIPIRTLETVMFVAILVFGVRRFVKHVK